MPDIDYDIYTLGTSVVKFNLPMEFIDSINKAYDENSKNLKPHNDFLAGKIREDKARIRRGQLDPHSQTVDRHRFLDPILHIGRIGQIRRIGPEHIDRKDQVIRRPRLPVAPLDSRANVHHHFAVVCIKLVPDGDPRQRLGVGDIAIEEVERLVEKVETRAIRLTGLVGMKTVVVLELAGADPEIETQKKQLKGRFKYLLLGDMAPVRGL